MSMIVSERPGPAWDSSIESPVRASEPSTRMLLPVEQAAAAGQRALGRRRDAVLGLGADHEEDEREQEPAGDRERDPLEHAAGGDRRGGRAAARGSSPLAVAAQSLRA